MVQARGMAQVRGMAQARDEGVSEVTGMGGCVYIGEMWQGYEMTGVGG